MKLGVRCPMSQGQVSTSAAHVADWGQWNQGSVEDFGTLVSPVVAQKSEREAMLFVPEVVRFVGP